MTERRKAAAMLSLVDPSSADALAATLRDRIADFAPGSSALVAARDPDDPSQSLAMTGEMAGAAETFDLSVHLSVPDTSPSASVDALVEVITSIDDAGLVKERCAALCGLEHTIVEGHEPYVHLFLLRRVDALTTEEFHEHWLNVHAELGHRIPGIGAYRQFHVSPTESAPAAAELGFGIADFDGLAETFCADHDAFQTIMNSDTVVTDGIQDQREFIDAGGASAALYKVVFQT